jgi:hypothetical protein
LGKTYKILATVENRSRVLEKTSKINGICFSLLADPIVIKKITLYNALCRCKAIASSQEYFNMDGMDFGIKQGVVRDFKIDLGVCVTQVLLCTSTLASCDMIIGMDWLESHEAVLDYKGNIIYFIDDLGHKRALVGTKRGVSLRFVLALELKKIIWKVCKLYVVIDMNKKNDAVDVAHHPILSKKIDVFLYELLGLMPK